MFECMMWRLFCATKTFIPEQLRSAICLNHEITFMSPGKFEFRYIILSFLF